MEIRWVWTFTSPFSIGTGTASAWQTAHLIAMRDGKPLLRGDAVKGAIRMSGERLVRWLCEETAAEKEELSVSRHPVLRRLFTWKPSEANGADYRFLPAIPLLPPIALVPVRFSTAIEPGRSTAKDSTLRSREVAPRGFSYQLRIVAEGGNWEEPESPDLLDLHVLVAALVACDAVGGGRAGGLGAVDISEFSLSGPGVDSAANFTKAQVERMQRHLRESLAERSLDA